MNILINNQKHFLGKNTLVITDERAEESTNRSKYAVLEAHRADSRESLSSPRYIDVWRAVHSLSTQEVWALLEEFSINPHPAYRLGWGRLSCRACIFGSPNQWASNVLIAPGHFEQLATLEEELRFTIDNHHSIRQLAERGSPYGSITEELLNFSMSHEVYEDIVLPRGAWRLPAGALGEMNGPS